MYYGKGANLVAKLFSDYLQINSELKSIYCEQLLTIILLLIMLIVYSVSQSLILYIDAQLVERYRLLKYPYQIITSSSIAGLLMLINQIHAEPTFLKYTYSSIRAVDGNSYSLV